MHLTKGKLNQPRSYPRREDTSGFQSFHQNRSHFSKSNGCVTATETYETTSSSMLGGEPSKISFSTTLSKRSQLQKNLFIFSKTSNDLRPKQLTYVILASMNQALESSSEEDNGTPSTELHRYNWT